MDSNTSTIFQFTSPQGDEQFRQIVRKFVVIFQFTSPQGDELATLLLIYRILYISIHVSARRRTFFPWHFFLLNAFQFTSPQGDELSADLTPRYKTNFNSRLRKETNSEKNQYAWLIFFNWTAATVKRLSFSHQITQNQNIFFSKYGANHTANCISLGIRTKDHVNHQKHLIRSILMPSGSVTVTS